jgi:preprotein translocase subunit SecG
MDILIGILTTVEVIVCLLLILVVLMQRPRQEGLGASFGDSAMTQLVGAQTTNVLQKFTVYLAIVLFALTLILAVLISRKQTGSKSEKIFGDAKPAPAAPAATDPHGNDAAVAAKLMEKIQEAAKDESKKAAATPTADDKKAEPAKAPAPAKSEPAKAPEAPKAAAPAPAATPAPAPAPAAQPK